MKERNLLEGVVTWIASYLGMLVGGLLLVVVMGCFLHITGRGR
jgi:hypothetical protein